MKKIIVGLLALGSISAFANSTKSISFPIITTDGEGTYFTQTCNDDETYCKFDHDIKFNCDGLSHPNFSLKYPRKIFGNKMFKILMNSREECHEVKSKVAKTVLDSAISNKTRQHVWINLSLSPSNSWFTGYRVEDCLHHND